jgi:hypothetical protein
MQEYINPEHYKDSVFGNKAGLTFIYQHFVSEILHYHFKPDLAESMGRVIMIANHEMLSYLKGNIAKYRYRAGRKIYPGHTPEQSAEIDKGKSEFYKTEFLLLLPFFEADKHKLFYPLLPNLLDYPAEFIESLTIYGKAE